jgi:hypothetical protein
VIFVVETEERRLVSFANESDAVAACEGLDVEAATWLFWSNDGAPLEPVFTKPNTRGLFVLGNGEYHLSPVSDDHHSHLIEALEQIEIFDLAPPLNSADAIRSYLSVSKLANEV